MLHLEYDYDSATDDAIRYIGECVKLALWPWNPGEVTLWRDEQIDLITYSVRFSLELKLFPIDKYPGHIFLYNLDPINDKIPEIRKMGQEAFKFYRYRPALPIDDHIILGEG